MPRLSLALALACALPCALAGCGSGSVLPGMPGGAELPPPTYDPVLACTGKAALGFTRLQVGFAGGDTTAAKPGFDLRYQYIAGVLAPSADCLSPSRTNAVGCGADWWGTWQWDQDPPGAFVRDFVSSAAAAGLRPMLTYYVLLPASQAMLGAGQVPEGRAEVNVAARSATFMAAYLADFRFLLRQIGTAPAIVHVEPDFWGYAQFEARALGTTADRVRAEVATANPTDCGGLDDTVAGLGQCLVAMVRAYAPNAKVGLHASPWGTGFDCVQNTSASLDVAAEARKTADFLATCAPGADLVVVDLADRDAGWRQSQGQGAWLGTSSALPSYDQAFRWSRALAGRAAKPLLWWQLPVGNTALPDVTNRWRDNKVEYFFAHPDRVAASGAVGMAFGAGAGGQTTPESDGGYLWRCAAALADVGGQPLCP